MKPWTAFKDGFIGAFTLTAMIVGAIVSIATAFAQGDIDHKPPDEGHGRHAH